MQVGTNQARKQEEFLGNKNASFPAPVHKLSCTHEIDRSMSLKIVGGIGV